ncbi:MAG: tetratricopeptide repeat protein [Parvibaculaceae bacterium]|nr:tetratricopeptide repeat protein [Parvibaculaceae bacterium]
MNKKEAPSKSSIDSAMVLHRQGEYPKAAKIYQKILKQDPKNLLALNLLAEASLMLGKSSQALQLTERALKLKPNMPSTSLLRANALARMGQEQAAIEGYNDVLALQPENAPAMLSLGVAQRAAGKNSQAIVTFEKLIELKPEFAQAHFNLANAFKDEGLQEDALLSYDDTLAFSPGMAEAWINKAATLLHLDRPEEALESAEQALKITPSVNAYLNAGNACRNLARISQAEVHYQKALALAPKDASLNAQIGLLLADQNRQDEAVKQFKVACALSPRDKSIEADMALSLLASGNLQEGWHHYEARFSKPEAHDAYASSPLARWTGEPLDGRNLLIWTEQGVGDILRFASCIPDLLEMAQKQNSKVYLKTEPRLISLFQRAFPTAHVSSRHTTEDEEQVDLQIPFGSLPKLLRPTLASFENKAPYIIPATDQLERMKTFLNSLPGTRRIGFAWRSGNMASHRQHHYGTLLDWRPLFEQSDASFVSLQYGITDQERNELADTLKVTLHEPEEIDLKDDMEAIAALTAAVDIVISPRTAVAVMAGTLGKPTFTYGPASDPMCLGTSQMPWFASMHYETREAVTPMSETVNKINQAVKNNY